MSIVLVIASIALRLVALYKAIRAYLVKKDWQLIAFAILILISLAHIVSKFGFDFSNYANIPLSASSMGFFYSLAFILAVSVSDRFLSAYTEKKQALAEHRDLFEQFATNSPLSCFIIQDDQIVYVNPNTAEFLGYSPEELKQINPDTLLQQNNHQDFSSLISYAQPGISTKEAILSLITKNGESKWGMATFGTATYNGKPAIVGTVQDITEKRETEEAIRTAETQMRRAINASETVIWDYDYQSNKTRLIVPDSISELYNFVTETSQPLQFSDIYELDLDLFKQVDPVAIAQNPTLNFEYRLKTIEGELVWWHLSGKAAFNEKGDLLSVSGTTRCIHEQKTASELVRENQARLMLANEVAGIRVWEWDLESNFLQIVNSFNSSNPPAVPAFSYEEFLERIHPEHRERIKSKVLDAYHNSQKLEEEFLALQGNEYRWQRTLGQVIKHENNKPKQVIGISIDTTERKQKEALIEFQAELLDQIGQSVFALNAEGKVTYYNKAAQKTFDMPLNPSFPLDISGMFPANSRVFNRPEIMNHLKAGQQWMGDIVVFTRAGEELPIFLSASPLIDEKGEFTGYICIYTDMSAQREMQEALRVSEERLRLATDATELVVWDVNLETGKAILCLPDSINEELVTDLNSLDSVISMLHPDDKEGFSFKISESLQDKQPFLIEHRLQNKHNEFDWWQSNGKPFADSNGNLTRMIGTSQKFTYRKEAELLLQKRMHELQAIYHVVDAVNKASNLESVFKAAANGAKTALGADRVSIITLDPYGIPAFKYTEELSETFQQTIIKHAEWISHKGKQSRVHFVRINEYNFMDPIRVQAEKEDIKALVSLPLKHKNQTIGNFIVFFNDTQTLTYADKQLATRIANHIAIAIVKAKDEKSLIESEEKNKAILKALPDLVFHVNSAGEFTDFNASKEQKLIIPREEIIGNSIKSVLLPHIAVKAQAMVEDTIATQSINVLEYSLEFNGQDTFFEARFAPVAENHAIIVIRDISERKYAEKELIARSHELLTIANTIPDAILRVDKDLNLKFANKTVLQATNMSLDEFINPNRPPLDVPDIFREQWRTHIGHVLEQKKIIEYDFDMNLKASGMQHFHATLAPESVVDGNVESVLAIIRNTTAERQLQQTIIDISARQQLRIGQDLHDELGQLLTGIGFKLAGLKYDLDQIDPDCAEQSDEISKLVEQAISQTRMLAEGLNPVTLEVHGLRAGLEKLVLNTESTYGISCDFSCDEDFNVLDEELAVQLYRIGQEAINNAVKHGKPTKINVSLTKLEGKSELRIHDDGRGIEEKENERVGHGMRIMNYRARVIGANLRVESSPNQGTVVRCVFQTQKEIPSEPTL